MRAGRTPALIVAVPPILPADGDRVEAAAGQQPSAALEITDREVVGAGEIGQPALAVGEAAVAAGAGEAAVAASAAAVSVAADTAGNFGDRFGSGQQKSWPLTMNY